MREKKSFMAIRITEAQKEMINRLAERLKMTKTEVFSLALYRLTLETFKKTRAL